MLCVQSHASQQQNLSMDITECGLGKMGKHWFQASTSTSSTHATNKTNFLPQSPECRHQMEGCIAQGFGLDVGFKAGAAHTCINPANTTVQQGTTLQGSSILSGCIRTVQVSTAAPNLYMTGC
jgi:hypothetical protein